VARPYSRPFFRRPGLLLRLSGCSSAPPGEIIEVTAWGMCHRLVLSSEIALFDSLIAILRRNWPLSPRLLAPGDLLKSATSVRFVDECSCTCRYSVRSMIRADRASQDGPERIPGAASAAIAPEAARLRLEHRRHLRSPATTGLWHEGPDARGLRPWAMRSHGNLPFLELREVASGGDDFRRRRHSGPSPAP
jgi:hypothetical protein